MIKRIWHGYTTPERVVIRGQLAGPERAPDLEREIDVLVSGRWTAAALQVISLAVLVVSWLFGWGIVAIIALAGALYGTFMGASWWLLLRGLRPPNSRMMSIEQLAREEVLAKRQNGPGRQVVEMEP